MISWRGLFLIIISTIAAIVLVLIVMKLFVIHHLDGDTRGFLADITKAVGKWVFIGSCTALIAFITARVTGN
jgi:hypothetical protein